MSLRHIDDRLPKLAARDAEGDSVTATCKTVSNSPARPSQPAGEPSDDAPSDDAPSDGGFRGGHAPRTGLKCSAVFVMKRRYESLRCRAGCASALSVAWPTAPHSMPHSQYCTVIS